MPFFLEVDPADVRFLHARIRPVFSCGRTIQHTLDEIRAGRLDPAALPVVTVVQKDNEFYSTNNRRIYLFKRCKELGLLRGGLVRVRVKHVSELKGKGAGDRYSPDRCSLTARVMQHGCSDA